MDIWVDFIVNGSRTKSTLNSIARQLEPTFYVSINSKINRPRSGLEE